MRPSGCKPAWRFLCDDLARWWVLQTATILAQRNIMCMNLLRTFEISLARPTEFHFKPGQRIRIHYGDTARDYTLVSSPDDTRLVLCMRYVEAGRLTPVLKNLSPGSRITFTGPNGYFTYRPTSYPVIFVATGVGVAPFCAMARSGIQGFSLLHGVRRAADLHYADVFQETARYYVPCFSRPSRCQSDGFDGRVTRYLAQQLSPGRYDFYLCGHQRMISDATLIIDDRFPNSLVYTEAFES